MEDITFLGLCLDYRDCITTEMARSDRLLLIEWDIELLREYDELLHKIVKELREDISWLEE